MRSGLPNLNVGSSRRLPCRGDWSHGRSEAWERVGALLVPWLSSDGENLWCIRRLMRVSPAGFKHGRDQVSWQLDRGGTEHGAKVERGSDHVFRGSHEAGLDMVAFCSATRRSFAESP